MTIAVDLPGGLWGLASVEAGHAILLPTPLPFVEARLGQVHALRPPFQDENGGSFIVRTAPETAKLLPFVQNTCPVGGSGGRKLGLGLGRYFTSSTIRPVKRVCSGQIERRIPFVPSQWRCGESKGSCCRSAASGFYLFNRGSPRTMSGRTRLRSFYVPISQQYARSSPR